MCIHTEVTASMLLVRHYHAVFISPSSVRYERAGHSKAMDCYMMRNV